jgi:hypothetical protein
LAHEVRQDGAGAIVGPSHGEKAVAITGEVEALVDVGNGGVDLGVV